MSNLDITSGTNQLLPSSRQPQKLSSLVTVGALRLRVAYHYPLSDIQNAHRTVEAGGLDGKVVISV